MSEDLNKFPFIGAAEELERCAKFDGAKEIYQKALEVANRPNAQSTIDKVTRIKTTAEEVKKQALEGITRVEEKARNKLKKIIKGKGMAIDLNPNDLKPLEEVQEAMPPIDARDYVRMKEDILARGVQVPLVVLDGTNEIICGYNRWRAAKDAKLEVVPGYVAEMTREEAIVYAIKDNLNRRHMTMAEKTSMVQELLKRRGKQTVGRPRKEVVAKRKEGLPITIRGIADAVGVNKNTVVEIGKRIVWNPYNSPKLSSFFIEKIPVKFREVKGNLWHDLKDEILEKVPSTLENLNLSEEDKVRAEITFYVKRKEK